jgi:hypothetical protein
LLIFRRLAVKRDAAGVAFLCEEANGRGPAFASVRDGMLAYCRLEAASLDTGLAALPPGNERQEPRQCRLDHIIGAYFKAM